MPQSDGPERPRIADVAIGLVLAAAAATIAFGSMIPFQIGPTVERERRLAANQDLPVEQLQQSLAVVAVVAVVVAVLYAALLAFFAWRLRHGRRRARIAILVLTVVAVLPLNGQALLVAAVLVVADVLLFRRPVSEWLTDAAT